MIIIIIIVYRIDVYKWCHESVLEQKMGILYLTIDSFRSIRLLDECAHTVNRFAFHHFRI